MSGKSRRQMGVELAKECPIDADVVIAVPDSGTPAAIGYAQFRAAFPGRTPQKQVRGEERLFTDAGNARSGGKNQA